MEDAVIEGAATLLPEGREIPFAEVGAALARNLDPAAQARALTATIVAVGPASRLPAAAEALAALGEIAGVRAILITAGAGAAPAARVAGNTIALGGLKVQFIDNAVAALRLSSLPTIVWWRGGPSALLDRLAHLADRLVLDEDHPEVAWRRALALLDRTAFSDLRWTRLTRWRALLAHFFDLLEVRQALAGLNQLRVAGADPLAARLFASWLTSSVDCAVRVELRESSSDAALEEVSLEGGEQRLTLRLAPSRTCVVADAVLSGQPGISRTVWLGDQSLSALLSEELRIRAHDAAFERALRACVGQ